jgi:biopolymer transport protein ExbD
MEEKEFNYINMVPFIDVMLVLIVIVLMTGTFIVTGVIPVELPKAVPTNDQAMKTAIIEIDNGGMIYYRSRRTDMQALESSLSAISRDTPFLIRADRSVHLQQFVDVLAMIRSMGFKKVSLQTEEKK